MTEHRVEIARLMQMRIRSELLVADLVIRLFQMRSGYLRFFIGPTEYIDLATLPSTADISRYEKKQGSAGKRT